MVNLPNIKIIGLTGMSGAGKSTVCGVFARRGFKIIDCDGVSRETAQDCVFLNELQSRFPEKLLNANGSLNRVATANLIFNDKAKLRLYNQIIFPYIVYKIMRETDVAGYDVILDAPTLFDSGLDMICTAIVGVTASLKQCAERITLRDGITYERALERLSAQRSEEFFKQNCDYIIENNGELVFLTKNVEKIVNELKGTTW